MGAVLVLTPLVIASWASISIAVAGVASAMGFAVGNASEETRQPTNKKKTVETEIENSEVVAEELQRGTRIALDKDGVHIEIGQDERGACTVCVAGLKQTEKELRKIGEEVAGRIVQQFAYHKLMTELKRRNYSIVDEHMLQDESIQVRVRL